MFNTPPTEARTAQRMPSSHKNATPGLSQIDWDGQDAAQESQQNFAAKQSSELNVR